MSIAFSEASSARIEAARAQGVANAARQSDLTIRGLYVQARATEDERLAEYVVERFTDNFRTAFDAWVEQGMPTSGPFGVPEYSTGHGRGRRGRGDALPASGHRSAARRRSGARPGARSGTVRTA